MVNNKINDYPEFTTDICDILDDNGIDYSNAFGSNEIMLDCPYCQHHKQKLSINQDNGCFQCFVCSETGHWKKLIKDLNISDLVYHKKKVINGMNENTCKTHIKQNAVINQNPEFNDFGISYLISRGIINSTTLENSLIQGDRDRNYVQFQYKSVNGDIVGTKDKYLDRKQGRPAYKVTGSHPGYYLTNQTHFVDRSSIIVVEGEVDALSVQNYLDEAGENNTFFKDFTVLATTGITNRGFIDIIGEGKTSVYIWFDNETDKKTRGLVDKAKKRVLSEITTKYPEIELYTITTPNNLKDANDYLQSDYNLDSFKELLENADPYLDGKVTRDAKFYSCEMMEFLNDETKSQGLTTTYNQLDKMLGGGYRAGELTVLLAESKGGKSTLIHTLIRRHIEANVASSYASRELSAYSEVLPNLLSMQFQTNMWLVKQRGQLNTELKAKINDKLNTWPLYFAKGYGPLLLDDLTRWLVEGKQKGVNHFYFDHLLFGLQDSENYAEISTYIRQLKTLVKELDVHLFLVVQPKVLVEGQKLSFNSIRGGGAILQALDSLLILEREPVELDGKSIELTKITLSRARHKLAKTGMSMYFKYNFETTELEAIDVERDNQDNRQQLTNSNKKFNVDNKRL